ncbi:hypothetical protein WA026_011247 [Henosepilachna vigintioctopunctata]|uniref:Reverse transcriptase domain-containing protein n=1 Tax=Henosepilachna vigintioctopunctata TaxID=420089 RepID=A0AAW1U0T3_9CUCU
MNCTLGTVNACGIRRKVHLLKALLLQSKISILSITETKLKHNLKVASYNTYQRNSPRGAIRGTALLVHTSLHSTEFKLPNQFSNLECVAAKVQLDNLSVAVFSYYHPPSDILSAYFIDYIASIPHSIILGDLNARNIQFGDSSTNRNGRILSDCLMQHNLWRCYNVDPTFFSHAGMSITDHIITTPDLIKYFEEPCFIGQSITSDHLPLLIHSTIAGPLASTPACITFKDHKNANWELFTDHLSTNLPQYHPLQNSHQIDFAIDQLSSSFSEAYSTCVVEKTININRPPLPPYIVNLIKSKRRLYRSFIRTRDAAIKTEYNRLAALIRREINRFKEKKWSDTTSKLDFRNGKEYWKKFSILTGSRKTSSTHLQEPNGLFTSNPQRIADIFKQHLENIFQIPQNPRFDNQHFCTLERDLENFKNTSIEIELNGANSFSIPIDSETVVKNINAGRNTAPGIDGLSRSVLRHLPPNAINLVKNIYNRCLELSYFPKAWKAATTILIPKPNKDHTSPDNYRPISLLNVLGKIFEKILNERLRDFAESRNIIPPFQHGFRPHHSTYDPLIKLHTDITNALNSGECVIGIFLDVQRAFDQVWHAGLVRKLLSIGLPIHFVKLIHSYLSDRTIRIKQNDAFSEPFTPRAGIPQGSTIAPILYLIYTHDMPHPVSILSQISLFADDTAIWTTARTSAKCSRIMQRQLDAYSAWAVKWRITPNPNKTQSILFHHFNYSISPKFSKNDVHLSLWGENLRLQDEIIYLGVTFSKYNSWNVDLAKTLKKVRNRANLLYALRGRIRGCDPRTLLNTYKAYIRPVITYRCLLYSTLQKRLVRSIESCERAICRSIFRLHRQYPSILVHEITKMPPIFTHIEKLQARYALRTLNGPNLVARQTLMTQWYRPGRVLRRKPRNKFPFPPARILHSLQELPDDILDHLEDIPLRIR